MNIKLLKGGTLVLEKEKVPYKLKDHVLSFILENVETTLNLETNEFTRENDEYFFYLDIEREICEITLKKEEYYLQVNIEYANLLKNKNIYILTYFIETDDLETQVIIELEGE